MGKQQIDGSLLDEIQSLRTAYELLLPAAKMARAAMNPLDPSSVERDNLSDAIGRSRYFADRAEALRVRRLSDD